MHISHFTEYHNFFAQTMNNHSFMGGPATSEKKKISSRGKLWITEHFTKGVSWQNQGNKSHYYGRVAPFHFYWANKWETGRQTEGGGWTNGRSAESTNFKQTVGAPREAHLFSQELWRKKILSCFDMIFPNLSTFPNATIGTDDKEQRLDDLISFVHKFFS